MNKSIITAMVLFAATWVSAAFQYDGVTHFNNPYWGIPTAAFNFSADMSLKLDLVGVAGTATTDVKSFGYYKINADGSMGAFVAADMSTGILGDFKAGDKIGLYFQGKDGYYYTSTPGQNGDFIGTGTSGDNFQIWEGAMTGVGRGSWEFRLSPVGNAPSGQPLPGILAVLAVGGAIGAGAKLKKRFQK